MNFFYKSFILIGVHWYIWKILSQAVWMLSKLKTPITRFMNIELLEWATIKIFHEMTRSQLFFYTLLATPCRKISILPRQIFIFLNHRITPVDGNEDFKLKNADLDLDWSPIIAFWNTLFKNFLIHISCYVLHVYNTYFI